MSDTISRPSPWPRSVSRRHNHQPALEEAFEREQAHHLERIIATKTPAELKAIADTSPELIADWLAAFKRQEAKAQSEVAAWRDAVARLAPMRRGQPAEERHRDDRGQGAVVQHRPALAERKLSAAS